MNAGRASPVTHHDVIQALTDFNKKAANITNDDLKSLHEKISSALTNVSGVNQEVVTKLTTLKTTIEDNGRKVRQDIRAPFDHLVGALNSYLKEVREKAKTVHGTSGSKTL